MPIRTPQSVAELRARPDSVFWIVTVVVLDRCRASDGQTRCATRIRNALVDSEQEPAPFQVVPMTHASVVPPCAMPALLCGDANRDGSDADHDGGEEAMFHCTQCKQFLPVSDFYPCNVRQYIHRCRKHTNKSAKRSWRKTRSSMSHERKAARRVVKLLRRKDGLPAWTRQERVVERVLRRFECRSVISGATRALVLVRASSGSSEGMLATGGNDDAAGASGPGGGRGAEPGPATPTEWKAWDSVPVTQREALLLARQPAPQRAAMLRRGALGAAIQGARREEEGEHTDSADCNKGAGEQPGPMRR